MGIDWIGVAESLIATPLPALVPPRRVRVVDVDLAFDGNARILMVCEGLTQEVVRQLPSQFIIERVRSFGDAVASLHAKKFRLVIVAPGVHTAADGVRFARACKFPEPTDESLERAIQDKCAKVPFLILPLPNDSEFAVFRSATDWFLTSTEELPLDRAITSLVQEQLD